MEFMPEEFRYITLSKINKLEKILPNCSVKEYLEAYKLFLDMIMTRFDIYLTLSFAQKLANSNICCTEKERIQIVPNQEFVESSIAKLKRDIEKDKRRILN